MSTVKQVKDGDGPKARQEGGRSGRSALVFIPGMSDHPVNLSVQALGTRVAQALNREAQTREARFPLEFAIREHPFGKDLNASVCTIVRDGGDGVEVPCIDLYKLNSVRTLRSRYEQYSLLRKALLPIVFIALYLRGVVGAFRTHPGKTRRERYQLCYATAVLALLTLYVILLVVAAVKTVAPDLVDQVSPEVPQSLVLALTALGLWKSNLVSELTKAAVGYICVIAYLQTGERRAPLVGQFVELMDAVHEQSDTKYDHIDVVAYSFGSIVALDAFFPLHEHPSPTLRHTRSLVTIGCPFDFVRTYWKGYYDGRSRIDDVPAQWLNFYSPVDILASNFRSDGEVGEPQVGISAGEGDPGRMPQNVAYGDAHSADIGIVEFLTFMGLRAHALYWSHEVETEETVFGPIVRRIYAGEEVLT
jgi:hypothetical protein